MIQGPSGPLFSFSQREELLKSMGRSLTLSRKYGAAIGNNSTQYRMVQSLRDAVEALATDLTTDADYYGGQGAPLMKQSD
jgi:hypothetical protein